MGGAAAAAPAGARRRSANAIHDSVRSARRIDEDLEAPRGAADTIVAAVPRSTARAHTAPRHPVDDQRSPVQNTNVAPTFNVRGSRMAEPPPVCEEAFSCPKVGPDAKLTLVGVFTLNRLWTSAL